MYLRADSCPLPFSNSTLSCVPVENVLMIVKNALNILQVRDLKEWLSNYHFLLVTSDIFNPFPSNFAGKVQEVWLRLTPAARGDAAGAERGVALAVFCLIKARFFYFGDRCFFRKVDQIVLREQLFKSTKDSNWTDQLCRCNHRQTDGSRCIIVLATVPLTKWPAT